MAADNASVKKASVDAPTVKKPSADNPGNLLTDPNFINSFAEDEKNEPNSPLDDENLELNSDTTRLPNDPNSTKDNILKAYVEIKALENARRRDPNKIVKMPAYHKYNCNNFTIGSYCANDIKECINLGFTECERCEKSNIVDGNFLHNKTSSAAQQKLQKISDDLEMKSKYLESLSDYKDEHYVFYNVSKNKIHKLKKCRKTIIIRVLEEVIRNKNPEKCSCFDMLDLSKLTKEEKKEVQAKRKAAWYINNQDKILEKAREDHKIRKANDPDYVFRKQESNHKNAEKASTKIRKANYNQEHPEIAKKADKKYKESHGPDIRARNRDAEATDKRKAQHKLWRQNNKDLCKAYTQKWIDKNPERYKAIQKVCFQRWYNSERGKRYMEEYRQSMETRIRSFRQTLNPRDKTADDTITNDLIKRMLDAPCAYCGDPPQNFDGITYYNGIDRVDNKIDYTMDNVVTSCSMCNYMKFTYNVNDFIQGCINISLQNSNILQQLDSKWFENDCPLEIVYNDALNSPGNYQTYKSKKKKKFELTPNEFEKMQKENCSYCNRSAPSGIDRIDSSSFYKVQNCTPCCSLCNRMKNSYDVDLFIIQCCKIARHKGPSLYN